MAWLNNDADLLLRRTDAVNHQQFLRSNMIAAAPHVAAINGPVVAQNASTACLWHQNMVREHQKRVKQLNHRHQQQILHNNFPLQAAIDPRAVQLQHDLLVRQLAEQAHRQNVKADFNLLPNGHHQLLAQNRRGHISNGLPTPSSTAAGPVGSFNNSGHQNTNGLTNLTGHTSGAANGSVIVADKCDVSVNNFQGSI